MNFGKIKRSLLKKFVNYKEILHEKVQFNKQKHIYLLEKELTLSIWIM